jgi:hypothetical protein
MKLVTAVVVLAALSGAAAAQAQTLGDVAQKEAERRKTIATPGKVFTNGSLRPEPPPSAPATPSPTAAAPAAAATADASGGQAPAANAAAGTPAAPPQEDVRSEAYWRKRITAEREALGRAQSFAEALQTRINVLSADFVNRDDPAQRSVIAADRQKALTELERVRREIDDHEKAIATIQDEARRAGVPAGWTR